MVDLSMDVIATLFLIGLLNMQVGKDQNATAFLSELDVDPIIGASVDCVSDYELEEVIHFEIVCSGTC